jgi:K+-transporting ATPase ATPase C chain
VSLQAEEDHSMFAHLRATLWLFVLTLLVCCVLYPLALWLIGQGLFPSRADGSLIVDENGTVRGSRLLAQPFSEPRYFRPRPSAVGYNAAASGGSNLAASNPLLRDRVARQLGPMVRFVDGKHKGQRVGPLVEQWFRDNPGMLGRWAKDNPTLAKRWIEDDDNKDAVKAWVTAHSEIQSDLPPDQLAVKLFERFAQLHPTAWPVPQKAEGNVPAALLHQEIDAKGEKEISDLQGVMFDPWLCAHPEEAANIGKVPADLVMASGSGLDPHITLDGARYQLEGVVEARAKESGLPAEKVRVTIERLLEQHSFRPLAGLVGVPLVNVLELNRAMDADPALSPASQGR